MSLKEMKARIASVRNTRKITSAMKMVSSVKLRKAQQSVQNAIPYMNRISGMMTHLMTVLQERVDLQLLRKGEGHTIIVAFASDSSLCGGFNSNMIRHVADLTSEGSLVVPVGRKMTDWVRKNDRGFNYDFADLMSQREYSRASALCDYLVDQFRKGNVSRVVLSYTHFISNGTQRIVDEQLLPIQPFTEQDTDNIFVDYILEPSATELLETLIPKVLRMKVYSAALDSFASEEAARVVAMQAATDNADNLLSDLTLQYNKQRQQAITNEILDLASGAAQI